MRLRRDDYAMLATLTSALGRHILSGAITYTRLLLLPVALASALAVGAESQVPGGPDTVVVQSGALTLRALLWRPHDRGPLAGLAFLRTLPEVDPRRISVSGVSGDRRE